jgi:hypothetical protein
MADPQTSRRGAAFVVPLKQPSCPRFVVRIAPALKRFSIFQNGEREPLRKNLAPPLGTIPMITISKVNRWLLVDRIGQSL